MADRAIHEMISAFAAGCMDKGNFVQFKDYLNEGGELPVGELGEIQNIVSMIPIILELEQPDPAIKDKVARKLIGMKDEIKAKLGTTKLSGTKAPSFSRVTKLSQPQVPPSKSQEQKSLSFSTKADEHPELNFPAEEKQKYFSPEETRGIKPKWQAPTHEFFLPPVSQEFIPEKDSAKLESGQSSFTSEEVVEKKATEQKSTQSTSPRLTAAAEEDHEKDYSRAAGWTALIVSTVLFLLLGFYSYRSFNSYNKQIEDLKSQISSLRGELAASNNFINNYNSLIEFFNYKDIIVTNLASSDTNEKASATILLSFNQKEGLMQFKGAKPLQQNQCYQLWMFGKGQPYSLGTFLPAGNEYLKITTFPFLPKEQIESYRITIEPTNGSQTPSSNIYMISSAASATPRGRVK